MTYKPLWIACVLLLLPGCKNSKSKTPRTQTVNFHQTHTANNPMYQTSVGDLSPSAAPTRPPRVRSRSQDSQQLAHHVLSAILRDPALNKSHVQVASYFGNVLIVGEVQSKANVSRVKQIVQDIPGVKSVALELKTTRNNPTRQQIEDSKTSTKVRKRLQNLGVSFSHLQVITNNDIVYILGNTSAQTESQITYTLEREVGVRSVQYF